MDSKFIEASQDAKGGVVNWGKFLLGRFTEEEWARPTEIGHGQPLLSACGWTPHHLLVHDLQTGEGAYFRPGGYAHADLQKHAVWVCPMFEPFLEWLYKQDLTDLDALPALVELPEAEFSLHGYRRPGLRPAHIYIDGTMNREGQHVLRCSCEQWSRVGTSAEVWEAWKEHVGPEGVAAWEQWHHPKERQA